MASPLTLDQLRLLAADRADMLKYSVTGEADLSDFLNEAMFTYGCNHELAALWDHLVTAYEDYTVKRHLLPINSNQEEYNLPADFYKLRKVFPVLSNGRGRALRKFDMDEMGSETEAQLILGTEVRQLRYRIMGNRIWFWPRPTSVATVELWYIAQYLPIENDDDLLDFRFPNGWEDYVVEGVAARALEKEESDSSHCRSRQQEILRRILVTMKDRDVGEPAEMIDSEGYDWLQGYYD